MSADQLKNPGIGFRSPASIYVVPLRARPGDVVRENRNTRMGHLCSSEWEGRRNRSVAGRIPV